MTPLNPPRSALERNFNLVHYTRMAHGGHFAFWEQPEAMVARRAAILQNTAHLEHVPAKRALGL